MSTLVAQTISNGTVSTSSANVIQGSAKAWVSFNGANGTRYAFYNVSSVTRSSTGVYTVNFTNALADTNYAWCGSFGSAGSSGANQASIYEFGTRTTSAVSIQTTHLNTATYLDPTFVNISVFD
jgi:hypothetical protein